MYETMAPTAALSGHMIFIFIAVQKNWTIYLADISAAFLHGQKLPPEREGYCKVPKSWPEEVLDFLVSLLPPGSCRDLVKMTKGGFGLAESPRLWYLEYRSMLLSLGFRELRLLAAFFVLFHPTGELRSMAAIDVDDSRMAGGFGDGGGSGGRSLVVCARHARAYPELD